MRNRHFGGRNWPVCSTCANDATTVPSEFGDRVEVGDLQVVVSNASREGLKQRISVTVSGIDDREVTDSFAVISSGVSLNASRMFVLQSSTLTPLVKSNLCCRLRHQNRLCSSSHVVKNEADGYWQRLKTRYRDI